MSGAAVWYFISLGVRQDVQDQLVDNLLSESDTSGGNVVSSEHTTSTHLESHTGIKTWSNQFQISHHSDSHLTPAPHTAAHTPNLELPVVYQS